MIMRDTVFCAIDPDADRDAIARVDRTRWSPRVAAVRAGLPLRADPQFDDRPAAGGTGARA